MALMFVFLLGIGNFALHRAVVESGHPKLDQIGWMSGRPGRRALLGAEFVVLLAALLMVAQGWILMAWAYLVYSLLNALAAWLILTRRL